MKVKLLDKFDMLMNMHSEGREIIIIFNFMFSDKRVKDWFLMSSPLPTITICLSYAFIVKILGPWLMRNRKPFQLRKTLIYYNLFQVLFSTWIFYEAWASAWGNGYSLRCEPVDYSMSPSAMRASVFILTCVIIKNKIILL
jgi:hypothetical protein